MKKLSSYVPSDTPPCTVQAYLRRFFPTLSSSSIRDAFNRRDVKVNGKRTKKDEVVYPGMEIVIFVRDEEAAFNPEIVFEDQNILLVIKPQGIASQENQDGRSSMEILCESYEYKQGTHALLCHRLDAQTGGLLLFAKNQQAYTLLRQAFHDHKIEKEYLCLIDGTPFPEQAEISAFLEKDTSASRVRISTVPCANGFPIRTGYQVLVPGDACLLKVHLYTGRTHQIRAQMAAIGHPVLGDEIYGNHEVSHRLGIKKLALWAVSMTLHTDGNLSYLNGRTFTCVAPFAKQVYSKKEVT